jgi:hypothetical protein
MLSACRTTTYWAIPGLNQTFKVVETVFSSEMVRKVVPQSCSCKHEWFFACFSMSFIFVLFMLHLLTVCALYVCLCDYVNMCMYLVLLCIFGKKLLRACDDNVLYNKAALCDCWYCTQMWKHLHKIRIRKQNFIWIRFLWMTQYVVVLHADNIFSFLFYV